jgi:GNAT superfamily N-acetyltransferase
MRTARFFRSTHRVLAASPAETPALASIYRQAWADCGSSLDEPLRVETIPSEEEVSSWFAGGFEIFRTRHEEKLVGVVRISFPGGACQLDHLAIDPELRQRGHGRALVEHSVGRARRAGASRMWVQLNSQLSEPLAFFVHLGFRESIRHHPSCSDQSVVLLEMPV